MRPDSPLRAPIEKIEDASPARPPAPSSAAEAGGAPWPAVLALGAGGQLTQVVLLRELLMVFHGNELAVGVILASWMFWVGMGSRLGGWISGRLRSPPKALFVSALALLALLPAVTLLVRLSRGLFRVLPGVHLSFLDMVVSSFLMMAPVGLLLGLQFVLLARVWRERRGDAGTSGASSTYVMEGAGAIAGGLLFTFVLVHHAGALHLSWAVGVLLVLAAAHLAWSAGRWPRRAAIAVLLASLLPAYLAFDAIEDWSYGAQWRMLAPDHRLVETRQSPHGTISVLRHGDQHSFFQSGHLAFTTAVPGAEGFEIEEMEAAILAHLSLAQHPGPRRLLLVGGGLRGVLREARRHPLTKIDYVEFDPAMIETARRHVPEATARALEDPSVTVFARDGRLHLRSTERSYDVIIVDVPDPTTAVLNRYYTRELFEEARSRLRDGGALVMGAGGGGDMRDRAVANRNATILHTLREVFEVVVPVPVGGQVIFLASCEDGGVTADARVLYERHAALELEESAFSPAYFFTLIREPETRRLGWLLLRHGRDRRSHLTGPKRGPLSPPNIQMLEEESESWPPVEARFFHNSDMRPIGYYHTLTAWDRLTRGDRPAAFDWIAGVRYWWMLALAALSLAPVAAARLSRKGPSAPLLAARLAVMTTGLSTMAMQVALLFSFQSVYGFVYEMIGLIVGLFMAGLVMGAIWMKRALERAGAWSALMGVQGAVSGFALAMVLLLPAAASLPSSGLVFSAFAFLTLGAGLFSGLGFPAAVACNHAIEAGPEKATGSVYGTELFGACAGALLAGLVIAPVLGVVACFLLSSLMNATALLALIVSGRHHAGQ